MNPSIHNTWAALRKYIRFQTDSYKEFTAYTMQEDLKGVMLVNYRGQRGKDNVQDSKGLQQSAPEACHSLAIVENYD